MPEEQAFDASNSTSKHDQGMLPHSMYISAQGEMLV